MKFGNVDFDTYMKHYPDEAGYFGPYGGIYISDELKAAMAAHDSPAEQFDRLGLR